MTADGSTRHVAVSATGLLRDFNAAGALTWADVHAAQQLAFLYGERDPRVQLAIALTVRALRAGSVCLDLARVRDRAGADEAAEQVPDELWPDAAGWLDALTASPAVTVGPDGPGVRPLRWVDGLLYLERHWADQEAVRRSLLARMAGAPTRAVLDGPESALELALASPVTVIAGGPGTGKTWSIRALIARLRADEPGLLIGLAAPTGKAAARMTESLGRDDLAATTLHALLGWKPGSRNRFVHDATNPLPHDVVIVDEMSMVSMLLMSRLLAALKPSARLVLVGDPDQLASVDAGSVLADITAAPSTTGIVARLVENHRFAGDIAVLAAAIRDGDADAALAVLASGSTAVRLVGVDEGVEQVRARVVEAAKGVVAAAGARDAAAAVDAVDLHRLLCGHRRGPRGVAHWARLVLGWLGEAVPGYAADGEFGAGRPVMMTSNAPDFGLHNGDTGVVLVDGGQPAAWFRVGGRLRSYSPFLLDGLTPVHAMTVHKAQGSQFRGVSVVLPPPGSPLLTRGLLYTAVTRAERSVLLLGDEASVREAIERPARRVSGLAGRLG